MANRRLLFKAMFAGVVGLIPLRSASAQQIERNKVRLEDQLISGLRAATPGQKDYLRQIVALVNAGTLPRQMVNLLYTWAIKRKPKVPFPYFQFALRVLAKRRGITVP
ncbi:MAG: hypothetical protein VXZ82_19635 [Planctomycetota bacterium]|nr:hypothetical protein [Planctomycetota bacterium]